MRRSLAVTAFLLVLLAASARSQVNAVSPFTNSCGYCSTGGGGGGGTGTVTSVNVTLPSWLAVAGVPITSAGTAAISSATGLTPDLVVGTCNGATTVSLCPLSASQVPPLNQNTTGSAAKWTTARNLAGNSVDGSANVAFANKFIVQGTSDAGLSAAQFLGSLGTGIVKNTTTTGVFSIAIAGDFPPLNQNTTGSAATLTTPRAIYGNNFDGSTALAQIIASTYGGTGNGFAKFSGPASSEKTFTLPNASAAILTDNAAVTVAQGGTGQGAATDDSLLVGNGTGFDLKTLPSCLDSGGNHLNYTPSTNAFSCGTSSGASAAAGSDQQVQFNSGGATAGDTGFLWDPVANALSIIGGQPEVHIVKTATNQYATLGFFVNATRTHYIAVFPDGSLNITRDGSADWSLNGTTGLVTLGVGMKNTPAATAPYTCASGVESAQYYNSVSKMQCICNGTAWVVMPGGTPGVATGC